MMPRAKEWHAKPLEDCRTLADRLTWVLVHREHLKKNAGLWSQMAGRNRSHVRLTISRGGEMTAPILIALANAAKVNIGWLVAGVGHPDDPDDARLDAKDPIFHRRTAIAMARKEGFVSDSAYAKALALSGSEYDSKDAAWWSSFLLKTTIGEMKTEPEKFQAKMREHQVQRNTPAPPEPKPAAQARPKKRAS